MNFISSRTKRKILIAISRGVLSSLVNSLALERIELMYSEAGRVAKEGRSSITTIKNLMNRLQEMLRKIDNDNSIDEV